MSERIARVRAYGDDVQVASFVTPVVQDVDDAAYALAHNFPGGVPALAQRMGVSPNTLQSKVNPNLDTHKVSLREAVLMQAVAGDPRILHAMAAALDHVALPTRCITEDDLTAVMARIGAEVGDVFREVQLVLSDRRVTLNERRRVAGQVAEAVQALAAVLKVL